MNPQQPAGYNPHQSMFPVQRSPEGPGMGAVYPQTGPALYTQSQGQAGYPPPQAHPYAQGQAGAYGQYGAQQAAPYYQGQLQSSETGNREEYTGGGFPLKSGPPTATMVPSQPYGVVGPGQQAPSQVYAYGQQSALSATQPEQNQSLQIPTFRAVSDRVREIVTAHTLDECGGRVYTPQGAQDLATGLAERCMMHLRDVTGGTYKIIVSASILQRAGAGLHTV